MMKRRRYPLGCPLCAPAHLPEWPGQASVAAAAQPQKEHCDIQSQHAETCRGSTGYFGGPPSGDSTAQPPLQPANCCHSEAALLASAHSRHTFTHKLGVEPKVTLLDPGDAQGSETLFIWQELVMCMQKRLQHGQTSRLPETHACLSHSQQPLCPYGCMHVHAIS